MEGGQARVLRAHVALPPRLLLPTAPGAVQAQDGDGLRSHDRSARHADGKRQARGIRRVPRLGREDPIDRADARRGDDGDEVRRGGDAPRGTIAGPASSPAPAPSPPSPSRPDSQPAVGAKPGPLPSTPNLGAFIADALEGPGPSRPPPAERISVPPIRSQPPGAKARELLARRLTGNSVRAPEAPKPPTIAFAKTGDAVDALKRRYEEKVSAARTSQARKYTKAGTDAMRRGRWSRRRSRIRVAIEFDPENAELKTATECAGRRRRDPGRAVPETSGVRRAAETLGRRRALVEPGRAHAGHRWKCPRPRGPLHLEGRTETSTRRRRWVSGPFSSSRRTLTFRR